MTRPSRMPPVYVHHAAKSLVCLAAALVVIAGCAKDEIASYSVPKPQTVNEKNVVLSDDLTDERGPDRMLAAILIHEQDGWFFKLTGPKEQVAENKDAFHKLLRSVKFADASSNPTWDLPEGWNQRPGSAERFATLEVKVEDGPPLEVTVSKLPVSGWPTEEYLLANVNRWRKQMGLPAAGRAQLSVLSTEVEVQDATAMVVDLVGRLHEGGMMPPFAGGASPHSTPRAAAGEPVELKYEKPEGWQPAPQQVSRGGITINYAAAFTAGAGDKQVEVTVSAAGGALVPNINRWRGQIGLPPASESEIAQAIETLPIGSAEGYYIELRPESASAGDQVIFGAIAEAKGQLWFFKLKGDAVTADREKENFREFLQSVRFE